MAVRRRLVDEVKPDPALEKDFVFSRKPQAAEVVTPVTQLAAIARSPLTTRVRADFAAALKRASLERQLNGVFPQTVQDILEEALEPWLRRNGYLN
jgi:hypothetical protein